jgi:YidC/Oxa1 family membrane protein insertase
MAIMNKQMLYMMPAMTLFIGWNLPAGLTLYWLLTNLAMILQQKLAFKKK